MTKEIIPSKNEPAKPNVERYVHNGSSGVLIKPEGLVHIVNEVENMFSEVGQTRKLSKTELISVTFITFLASKEPLFALPGAGILYGSEISRSKHVKSANESFEKLQILFGRDLEENTNTSATENIEELSFEILQDGNGDFMGVFMEERLVEHLDTSFNITREKLKRAHMWTETRLTLSALMILLSTTTESLEGYALLPLILVTNYLALNKLKEAGEVLMSMKNISGYGDMQDYALTLSTIANKDKVLNDN